MAHIINLVYLALLMPLTNRVTPFSTLQAVSSRGTLMGNRGILHDENGQLTSHAWKHKSWISCVLEYEDRRTKTKRRRKLMQPGAYTELFFLDEITALAAGHRPCAFCSRPRYNNFMAAWEMAGLTDQSQRPTAKEVDARLHKERVQIIRESQQRRQQQDQPNRQGKTTSTDKLDYASFSRAWKEVPKYAMVEISGDPLVKLESNELAYKWSHEGYKETDIIIDRNQQVRLLTCPSICKVLDNGYIPLCHSSATTWI